MGKMGRPTDDPKDKLMSFRFSESDAALLEELSVRTKQAKTEIVRKGIRMVADSVKKGE